MDHLVKLRCHAVVWRDEELLCTHLLNCHQILPLRLDNRIDGLRRLSNDLATKGLLSEDVLFVEHLFIESCLPDRVRLIRFCQRR